MQFTDVTFDHGIPIDGYGPGFFRVNGDVVKSPVWVGPDGAGPWGGYDDVAPLVALAGQVDVLFIGTGADIAHLPPALRDALTEAGIAFEPMGSGAAARTYNVLLSEGRRVAVALVPV